MTKPLLADAPDFMRVKQIPQYVPISEKTCYRLIETGELRAAHVGAAVVVSKAALLELLGEGAE